MEGISVLHGELAHADQSAAGTRLVAVLRLDLVDHKRKIGIRFRDIPRKVYGGLFMRHTENHFRAVAIGKPSHLAPDARVSAGLFPERSRHHDGEKNFLSAYAIHFFPQNIFDFAHDAFRGGKKRITARTHKLHVTALHHKGMACDLTILRRFLESRAEQISD